MVPGRAATYNQLLGGVRMTQKRRVLEWAIQNKEIGTLRSFIEENQNDFLMKVPSAAPSPCSSPPATQRAHAEPSSRRPC